MEVEPPPIMPGPPRPSGSGGQAPPPPPKAKQKAKGPLGAVMAALAAGWKFILPALKFAKGAKFLITGFTMIASVLLYSLVFGWKFALGFVICIFVHEMGHVVMAKREGVPVSAPIFIPGFGALIMKKKWSMTAWGEAVIGIGGPIGGTCAAFACWTLYYATGNPLFLALAYFAFFMNLFNMTPIFPLDGGWIVGSISPYLWLVGLIAFAGLSVAGIVRNPFVWIIIIMSIPHVYHGIKEGKAYPGALQTTPQQKIIMGLSYLALCGVLIGGMVATQQELQSYLPVKRTSTRGGVIAE